MLSSILNYSTLKSITGLLSLAITISAAVISTSAQEKIVFASNRDGNEEIYVMNADGSSHVRLTNNALADGSPAISPDGNKVVFATAHGPSTIHISIMNIDGSGLVQLTSGSSLNIGPTFSPDGTKILFTSASAATGGPEVYVMDVDGSNKTRLTDTVNDNYAGNFSPDGTKIVLSSTRNGTNEVFVMDANGSNQTKLTDDNGNQNNDNNPRFSPDGTKIVFEGHRPGVNAQVYIMDANGANLTQLTNTPAPNQSPAFSPDGSKIVFHSNRDADLELYTMNANGSSQTRLTNNPGFDWQPFWGPEGNAAPTISATAQSVERDSTGSYSVGSVSDAEDDEDDLVVTVNGGASATVNGVTLSGISVAANGTVSATIAATCGASNASFTLTVTDSGSKTAAATLNVTVTAETVDPTLSLPDNIVVSLAPNSTDTTKIVTFTVSATDNCDAAPTVVATPESGSAFSVGTTTVNVVATDASGNTANGSFTVTVLYNFAGFFQPVDNLPVVNIVSAGQSIPLKFSLSGDKGLNIFAAGSPTSQMVPCTGGSSTSPIEETVTAGSSSLTYDATADRYQYVWKTQKAWRGTCRLLIMTLNDGSTHTALFQFK